MTVSGILEQRLILGQWAEPKAFTWKTQSPAALVHHTVGFWGQTEKGRQALSNWKDDLELSVVQDYNVLWLCLELRCEGSFPSASITGYMPLNLTGSLWQTDMW